MLARSGSARKKALGPGPVCGRSPLRRGCRDAAVDPSEENPRPRARPSNRRRGVAHRETRARHRRFPHEGRTARRPACSRPRETAHRRTRRRPQADHAVRAIPSPLAHENHRGPTAVACELDSRRANLASAIGSIEIRKSRDGHPDAHAATGGRGLRTGRLRSTTSAASRGLLSRVRNGTLSGRGRAGPVARLDATAARPCGRGRVSRRVFGPRRRVWDHRACWCRGIEFGDGRQETSQANR